VQEIEDWKMLCRCRIVIRGQKHTVAVGISEDAALKSIAIDAALRRSGDGEQQ
jgi:hypothetical protein